MLYRTTGGGWSFPSVALASPSIQGWRPRSVSSTVTTNSSASNFASCHSDAAGPLAASGAPVVALVGAPNVGKSTLFNSLTGARRQVGNWPAPQSRSAVRWSVPLRERTAVPDLAGAGSWDEPGSEVALLDLPGAYSLDAISPDEQFTRTLLMPPDEADRPDLIVVVADASRLARSLYLVSQVRGSPRDGSSSH